MVYLEVYLKALLFARDLNDFHKVFEIHIDIDLLLLHLKLVVLKLI